MNSEKLKVAVISRNYPKPGGRVTLLKNLVHEKLVSPDVITFTDEKEPFQLIKFNLSSYKKLKKTNPDIVLGAGLGCTGGMLYGLLRGKKTIYNMSGCRNRWYNLFAVTVLDEFLSMLLAKKIIVPSKESRDVIVGRMPFLKKKIEIILEGSRRLGKKEHKGFNIGFTLVKDDRIYDELEKNSKKFRGAALYFIPLTKISKVSDGKKEYVDGMMADILPHIDLMFICQTLQEFHSSTMIECIVNKVPFFCLNMSSAKKELKGSRLLIEDLKLSTFIKSYEGFKDNPKPYLEELEKQYIIFDERYNYDRMIVQWKDELSKK